MPTTEKPRDCAVIGSLQFTPLKMSGQHSGKGELILTEERHGRNRSAVPKIKLQTPSSDDREATTQRSLNVRRKDKQ